MKKQNRVVFFNILSTLLLRGISIFTAPLFLRLLGDSSYGMTQIYVTWTGAFAILFSLQTTGTLINARVEYPEEEQKKYQSSVMTLSVLLFLTCSAVVVLFLNPISGAMKLPKPLILMMLVQAFGTFCVNFLNTRNVYEFKAGHNLLLSLGVTLTTLILSVAFILMLPEEINYYGRITATAATYGIIGIPVCIYILARGKTFVRRDYWKFCIALALPSVFYNMSDLILGQSDKVMLQQMLSVAETGQYSAALNFGSIMFAIFNALNNSWCPFFFEDMKQRNEEQLRQKAEHFLELFTVLSVGFVLLAREVFHIYAPAEYWTSTHLIPIFVLSYYLNFLCTFPVNFEYYHKKTKVVAAVTIACSLVNIVLNYFFIQRMGMAGAAVATAASHGLQLMLHYGYTRYFLGKGAYPFGISMWGKFALVYGAFAVASVLTPNLWLVRWGIGAVIGAAELLRIRKRGVLI